MPYAIELTNASYLNSFDDFALTLSKGGSAAIVTANQEENSLLCRIVTGITPLTQGTVAIENRPIHELSVEELPLVRQKIGFVPASGGLISNLKMWENILLPSLYHHGMVSAAQEHQAEELLDFFGFSKNLMILPAALSLYEKRITAFVRAAIQNPSIMLYAGCFDGMSDVSCKRLIAASHKLQSLNPELTSLFLTSSEETLTYLAETDVYYLHNGNRDRVRKS